MHTRLVLLLWILGVAAPIAAGVSLMIVPIQYINTLNSFLDTSACRVNWHVVNHTAMTIEVNLNITYSSAPSAPGKNVTLFPPCGVIYCTGGDLIGLKDEYQPGAEFECWVCDCAFAPTNPECFCVDNVATQPYGYNIPAYVGGAILVLLGILMFSVAVRYSCSGAEGSKSKA
jgi:hypothetical protein